MYTNVQTKQKTIQNIKFAEVSIKRGTGSQLTAVYAKRYNSQLQCAPSVKCTKSSFT